MADASLNPGLRQVAEQYLQRALAPDEEARLRTLQQALQSQAAPPQGAMQQARQQARQLLSQGQEQALTGMRGILESIHQSSSAALQVQEQEEQAILKLLEGTRSLAELRPSHLQPERAALQPSSQLALTQIAEHLSNLARDEVEKCFQQTFGPLTEQLRALAQQMQARLDSSPEVHETMAETSKTQQPETSTAPRKPDDNQGVSS
jgi:ElaB/YqjD/DUF883 family membrane-anchored ribosome-binding protein